MGLPPRWIPTRLCRTSALHRLGCLIYSSFYTGHIIIWCNISSIQRRGRTKTTRTTVAPGACPRPMRSNSRCRIIIGIQKWTIILTTTHVYYVRFRAVPSNGEPNGKESGAQNGNCTAIISSTIELRAQG